MDIKSFILIGGGVMIAAVVIHGFWIAWRARREPLRLDIVEDLIPRDFDENSQTRGELPNGGARIRRDPEQVHLELDEPAPMLMDATGQVPATQVDEELFGSERAAGPADPAAEPEPAAATAAQRPAATATRPGRDRANTTTRRPAVRQGAATIERAAARARVREVELEPTVDGHGSTERTRARRERANVEPARTASAAEAGGPEDLLVMYVLAPRHHPFEGADLVTTLRGKGLRYGQMNIFHRLDPMSKVTQYSVANAVEPGTFDLSDISALSTPGLTFFMRLPGPQQPQEAFDDMWRVARDVAIALGGELKDDQRCSITAQTIEHYRQRILDFSRRSLSRRA